MPRKVMVGVAAFGLALALRQVVGRAGRRMRRHCEEMAATLAAGGRPLSDT